MFAYKLPSPGVNRSLSAFTIFVREGLDSIVRAIRCAQYVNNIAVEANTTLELIQNIQPTVVFKCFDLAGLKLSADRNSFGQSKVKFSGNTISCQRISPVKLKTITFRENFKWPTSVVAQQRYIGFAKFSRQYKLHMAETLLAIYKPLQKDTKLELTDTIPDSMFGIIEISAKTSILSLRMSLPETKPDILSDANEQAASYVPRTENYTDTAEPRDPSKDTHRLW